MEGITPLVVSMVIIAIVVIVVFLTVYSIREFYIANETMAMSNQNLEAANVIWKGIDESLIKLTQEVEKAKHVVEAKQRQDDEIKKST